jgi:hypothetical protein
LPTAVSPTRTAFAESVISENSPKFEIDRGRFEKVEGDLCGD